MTALSGLFSTPWLFVAGAICAAGPIIIHLLNRRRYRTVSWAAMDFLREALQRNRRIMQMRDIILLILRTAAVVLLGMALAGFMGFSCTPSNVAFDRSQPLHAILVVDNSMSMGYRDSTVSGTLLDEAKNRLTDYIESLPAGSRISVLPLCGSRHPSSFDAYATKEDALAALDQIEIVDRPASFQQAVDQAQRAIEAGPDLARRVVFVSDQQEANWTAVDNLPATDEMQSIQVVDVAPASWENSWVSEFRLQDGIADVNTPAVLVAELRHQGAEKREDVKVTLSVDGQAVADQVVTLQPGEGAREVTFEHRFSNYQPEPGNPIGVPVMVSIASDKLPVDDQRTLVAHVAAAVPVVFIDQYGASDESADAGKIGETLPLRKFLAPKLSRTDERKHLVSVRHISVAEVTQQILADARLVVIAGVSDPGTCVPLLREYVAQGGPLVIAAGGEFDPARWNQVAWEDGHGILPMPLDPVPLGQTIDEASQLKDVYFINYDTVATHEFFQLSDNTPESMQDLFTEPIFFKVVSVAPIDEEELVSAELERLKQEVELLSEYEEVSAEAASAEKSGGLSSQLKDKRASLEARVNEVRPRWLSWSKSRSADYLDELPPEGEERDAYLKNIAERRLPSVLAKYTDQRGTPYIVSGQIGDGQVIWISTGLGKEWNSTNASAFMTVYDHMMRLLVQETLPKRNFKPESAIPLPLPENDPELLVELTRPSANPTGEPGAEAETANAPNSIASMESVDTTYIGSQRAATLENPLTRGFYRLAAYRPEEISSTEEAASAFEIVVSVNGEASESNLASLDRDAFEERFGGLSGGGNDQLQLTWVAHGEEISLTGTQRSGRDWWWYLTLAVVLVLLLEIGVLVYSSLRAQNLAQPANVSGIPGPGGVRS